MIIQYLNLLQALTKYFIKLEKMKLNILNFLTTQIILRTLKKNYS